MEKKNSHKNLGTVLAKSFSVYMNGVMETNWSEWSVAVLCFSDVFLWLQGEHITLQLNEIPGLFLSFDSIGKCQIKLALMASQHTSVPFLFPSNSKYICSSLHLLFLVTLNEENVLLYLKKKGKYLLKYKSWECDYGVGKAFLTC